MLSKIFKGSKIVKSIVNQSNIINKSIDIKCASIITQNNNIRNKTISNINSVFDNINNVFDRTVKTNTFDNSYSRNYNQTNSNFQVSKSDVIMCTIFIVSIIGFKIVIDSKIKENISNLKLNTQKKDNIMLLQSITPIVHNPGSSEINELFLNNNVKCSQCGNTTNGELKYHEAMFFVILVLSTIKILILNNLK